MPDSSFNRGSVARLVAVGAACLVVGFLGAWFLRPDAGDVKLLPTATVGKAGPGAAAGTTVSTTATAPAAPVLPKPADVKLAVLNGTTIAGFAAKTATRAQGLGYTGVSAGNTPTTTEPTTVYFREGKRPAAQRVAKDMGFTTIKALPTSGAVATSAPAEADVVLVLGASGT